VLDRDLAQDGVAVVRHDDSAHRVHQHLQHGLGPQTCSNHVGYLLKKGVPDITSKLACGYFTLKNNQKRELLSTYSAIIGENSPFRNTCSSYLSGIYILQLNLAAGLALRVLTCGN
jgi:hypothetical protein